MEMLTVKATERNAKAILEKVNYDVFEKVYHDKSGHTKAQYIDMDLLYIRNCILESKKQHSDSTIALEVGVMIIYTVANDLMTFIY